MRIIPRLDFGETSRNCLIFYACCLVVCLAASISLELALERRGFWRLAFLVRVLTQMSLSSPLNPYLDFEVAC
jgi:hypothetical protein